MEKYDFSSASTFWIILKTDWKLCILGAIFSFLLASLLMSGWPSGLIPNIDFPYSYSGDGLFSSWMIQRIKEGWLFNNPRSGYPFGSNFLDYPGSDSGNLLILKLVGLLTRGYHSTLNLYFLLGFSVTFIASYCVLRALGLVKSFAFTCAILFDFLPFHFQRLGMGHLFYTWYFVVPIFYYFSLKFFNSNFSDRKTKTSLTKKLLYGFCLVSLGSFGVYFALFGLIVFFVVSVSELINHYNPKTLRIAFFSSCLVVFGVLLNLTPNLIYTFKNGKNPEVAQRSPVESEYYALKFVGLVLPRHGHRISKLAKISEKYQNSFPMNDGNWSSSLGLIASLGLLSLIYTIFASVSGRRINKPLRLIPLIVSVLFMFGTIGGFGSIFALVISPNIRGWDRVSVFIGFGALLGFFTLLQDELQKYCLKRRFIFLYGSISILFLLVGLYDQTVPPFKTLNLQTQKSFNMDKEFIRSIENSLPVGSAIYQIPYMPFSDTVGPLNRLSVYDSLLGFVHSKSLNWSYGGMAGREGDLFYRSLAKEPIKKQLEVIKKLGFAGICIDKRGFSDNGQAIIDNLTVFLGAPPALKRKDGEIVFFPLMQESPIENFQGFSPYQIMEKVDYLVDLWGVHYSASLEEGIDFTRTDFPIFVKDISGLSVSEPIGRWSDANLAPSVRIDQN